LPEESSLKHIFTQYGKFDGFYTKSLNQSTHLIYISFIKPRYAKAFRKEFESISSFDHEKTKLVSLKEAAGIKKKIKNYAKQLRDLENGIRECDEKEEVLSSECFLQINNIPSIFTPVLSL